MMRRLLLAFLVTLLAPATLATAQVIGVQPTPIGLYQWSSSTDQFNKLSNTYNAFPLANTPQPFAFYGWNSSLQQWVPCDTVTSSCPLSGFQLITSITETSTVSGPIVFAGGGVTQSGQTFTFAQPIALLASTFVGVPGASQVLYYVPASVAMTVPTSCTNSYMKAATAATASSAFTLVDVTKSLTLCTATFSASGTVAAITGTGGAIAAGDIVEILGPASPDATLATIGASFYATR